MVRLALRNLFQSKVRLLLSVGGVTLALTLILVFDAIFAGSANQLATSIERSGADIWVSQSGVRTLHMSSSSLPATVVDQVRAVPGVETATPILYVTTLLTMGRERYLAYVFGVPRDTSMGKPWRVVAGTASPAAGGIVVDRGLAEEAGIGIGDQVSTLGSTFTVVGLSVGTTTITNTSAFITIDDFARLRGTTDTVSYVLVKVRPGESPDAVASRIEAQVGGVTAQSRQAFARQERQLISDMSTDVLAIMNLIGLLTGLAVLALTVYTATLARRAEYGVLKALGARNRQLYRTVLAQAGVSIAAGLMLSAAVTLILSVIVPIAAPTLALQVSGASLLKVTGVALIIGGPAAVLPIRQIAGLDPAMVFRSR